MSAKQNSQKKYPFELEPFSRAFLENRNKTMEERIALGMREAAKYLPISFPENCMLPTVGVRPVNGAVGYIFGGGIFCELAHFLFPFFDFILNNFSIGILKFHILIYYGVGFSYFFYLFL